MLEHQKELNQIISCVGDLPALPTIVADVLSMTEDPTAAMSQISEHVQRDPAMAAKILKVSNSPYYGMKQYVGTLKLALVILGVREIRNIVLGISVFETLCDGKVDNPFMQDFWEHSSKVGALSKRLGATLALGLKGEDFISGLLHDIGKLGFWRRFGPAYMRLFTLSNGDASLLRELEMHTYGFNHADLAAALAAHWNLPQALADALWHHHATPFRLLANAKDPHLAALVRITNLAAHEDFSDPAGPPPASCTEDEAWDVLRSPLTPTDAATRRNLLAAFVTELDMASKEPVFPTSPIVIPAKAGIQEQG